MPRSLIIATIVIVALIAAYFWIRSVLSPETLAPQPQLPPIGTIGPLPSLPALPSGPQIPGEGVEPLPSGQAPISTAIDATAAYQNPISDFALSEAGLYLDDLKEKKIKLFVDKNNISDILDVSAPVSLAYSKDYLLYGSQTGGNFTLRNLGRGSDVLLRDVVAADMFSDGKNIAAHFIDNTKGINELRLIPTATGTTVSLLPLRFYETKILALSPGKIAVFEKPSAYVQSALYLVSFSPTERTPSANINSLFPEAYALDAIASPNGRFLFVSYFNQNGALTNVILSDSGRVIAQPTFNTLAQKCAFSADSSVLVCARPSATLDQATFEQYLREEFVLNNAFSAVDLKKLQAIDFSNAFSAFDPVKLAIDQVNGVLYFLNRNDKLLYSFILPTEILVETGGTESVVGRFIAGDRVRTNGQVNVRGEPSISATRLGSQVSGVSGIITGGPVSANDYVWWQVDYENGADGWSVENFLELAP